MRPFLIALSFALGMLSIGRAQMPSGPGNTSQVFPNGEFPAPAGPEIPFVAVPQTAVEVDATAKQPLADYAPPGTVKPEVQDAPGAVQYAPAQSSVGINDSYGRVSLTGADYYIPAVGPQPFADYAPQGLEARGFQEAPGVSEFTRITPPVPVTPEERERFVTRGFAPNSFLIPGSNTSFRIRGFVRATGLYDFNPIGSRDDFVTATIPVPQQSGQNANVAARYSRFAVETWTPTPIHAWNVHTFIEADFFNGPNQAVGGGGNPFRLRFAFADFGYFRVGQQNTVFMDGNAWPNTVDFAGPRGLVNQRRPGARVTIPLADKWFIAGGVEQPFSDITTNDLGDNVQNVPDFATHLRYEGDVGHVQLSQLYRVIGYQPYTSDEAVRRGAFGFSASTVFHPWAWALGINPARAENPSGLVRSRVLLQYTFGWGIGRYIQDSAGLGLDAQVDPLTGAFNTVYASGMSASYEHWFTERWLANLTYSSVRVGTTGGQPGSTYAGANYLATSLWYIPIRNMSIGAEYLYGDRDNLNGERGHANRINALFQYNF